ncbi:MAG: ShlB/FhaC/HecB family hemolysin secretion/activation protein [Rhodoferax sp.]|uniref:ShlB/FhaC/HecB family hemolysin secretion/activation protein n=1 Tax=Rhodoferax sp. TaxID=50421 RepID=UPI002614987C|nr:ShlB/FhaC/HecB family hemolysin secretion/activation protein [Rhodoferax sp.]MDD5333791.1 ShlB/FhaC/HecB family hemolysin secretion/activation protein [Rhodoferax sp.]
MNQISVLALLIFSTGLALGQSVPDAGSLRQQIEQGREPPLPRKALPAKPAEPAAMRALAGVVVTVKSFRFSGNTLLTDAQLAPVVADYLNRPVDFAQLQAAAAAVANAYREAGWIVRAYLPAQDIKDNVVTIQIVESVFGSVHLDGAVPPRIQRSTVLDLFDARQKAGQPLDAAALDRALLLADDLPGVTVSGLLREGAGARETDLVLKLAAEPLVAGEAAIDNAGARSTGSDRVTANLTLNSPFSLADLAAVNAIHTQGSDYVRLGYTFPVGSDGWRTGANLSALNYRLVAPEFTALDARGRSGTAGWEASYPIIRSRLKNLYFNTSFDHKTFDNQSGGATTTQYQSNSLTLGLAGNLFDKLGGGAANSASLALIEGSLNLDGSPSQAADASTAQTAGRFAKLRFAASRQQTITDTLSLFAALSGQRSSKNLDSSEKFYLGGMTGVRAYPADEAAGAEGELLNLELRWRLPQGFNVACFYDHGHVTINHNNNFVGAAALNDYRLKGAGLSLAWQSSSGPSLKGTWARRIGDNPNLTATGNDQDGSLRKNRFWLTASLPF